ncbi:MAG: hypothetical protein DRO90_02155 [Candidatus Altiarchaeales archaeon]|nr:MAG: hypothetical protein DRO95_03905 [Candidatus Altiarchaeales archaeon]RLI94215.1 MAG: hypothetical protein DRO94_03420 [Candidatus Altiarchaeales archaeon]RLI94379.1 MAG: hypothetical protein DRO90_02155 [Candidatus Altiarchaeales archaeon]HDO82128.1 hypothetical protein [Candidatus Altiarchaeales archaeon]HEX54777.1 hypothetical protein [Candidatus Altiarchaeales archaeon]
MPIEKFLDQATENERFIANGFIVQVYNMVSYYCKRCRKFSDRMCECGNFPEPIFRISGLFSDGTRTYPFITLNERIAEKLSGVNKDNAINLDKKEIMKKPYRIMCYIRNKKLYITDVLDKL